MSIKDHSPAPWTATDREVWDANNDRICFLSSSYGDIEAKEVLSTLAAAPEALEVLARALPALVLLGNYIGNEWKGGGGIEPFDRCALILAIKDVLAKVKG